uniref:transposase n=1 Tax=Enterocloster sp. TaxID=2719315 RepID=UPI00308075E8
YHFGASVIHGQRSNILRLPCDNHSWFKVKCCLSSILIVHNKGVGQEWFKDSTPVNTPCSTTILSSVRLNGKTSYTVYCGGTTGERFAEYLKTKLIPTLSKTDVIVMDNMRSHHAKIVKQVLDESEIKYLYLPSYSPDLNPIEKMWSKLKAYLRKEKVRVVSELPAAIERAFSTVRVSD